jgi:hypothetical protein
MLMQACSLKQPSNKCSQNIAAFSAEQIPAAKAGANPFPSVFWHQRYGKRWRFIIHMAVVTHDPRPYGTNHMAICFSNKTMVRCASA